MSGFQIKRVRHEGGKLETVPGQQRAACSHLDRKLVKGSSSLRCIFLLQAELNSVKQQGHEALQQLETRLHGYEAQSAEIQAFLQDKAFILQEAAEAEARLEAERQTAAMRLR